MKTLILGGVRSGKSRLAESLAGKSGKNVLYIATATADDKEMQTRIETHKQNRSIDCLVVEEPIHLAQVIKNHINQDYCILVDCLTLWITNLIMLEDKYLLCRERNLFIEVMKDFNKDIIFVSNETSMGIMPLGELTRQFGDEAGVTNQLVAALCDRVVLTVAGLPLTLKGNMHEI